MKIFVTGASGYIGQAVAGALARTGHEVFGLVRSREKAAALGALEVRPVLGTMEEPDTYREAALGCSVLIHCAAEYTRRYMELDRGTIDTLVAGARETGRPRLFIYTSGVWVYGNTGQGSVDEAAPPNPPAMVVQRVAHEEAVLQADGGNLRTLVVRPGCVYGGRGGLTSGWFESALAGGAARVVGEGHNRWAMIHVEDLADLYVRAAQSPWRREVFNATDRSRFTVLECARAASRAAGADGKVELVSAEAAAQQFGPMVEGFLLDQHCDSRKAVRMLGWQPCHGGFADGAERYFEAWKATAGR